MSEKRFRFLVRCLRFDDMHDRAVRKQFDKLAPIRDIFKLMVDNFQKYYYPSEYVTIDEQLLAFRGKCPFRQYIPSKPAKYGIKPFALVDSRTVYTLNLETYLGVQPDRPYKISNASQDVVLRIVEHIFGTNRNITIYNRNIPIEHRRRAKILLGEKDTTAIETERSDGSRGRCYDCGRARDKTTRRWCCKC
ncbi:piggyBac transposable element-derived protein 4-like [Melanaphis sacchari]|uniref:piggyBac transposable element-derived protein 4-like n=1 Tax=Melanaphis sacchari TaxID=742174 RepID=UPI000DC13636|nr:piggyBac transposable element-derived protein 4-like [Melanaphis sacchari]